MKTWAWYGCLAVMVLICSAATLPAALTPNQRKEITTLKAELRKVAPLIGKSQFEEATTILNDIETKLKQIATDSSTPETDRVFSPSFKQIATQRELIVKKSGKGGVSFAKDIAPIISAKCGECHNANDSSGQLNLDTFAGMKKGGKSGVLLVIGNANNSLLMRRLVVADNTRMPRGRDALPAAEIATIGTWINQGAKFDGDDESTSLADLKGAGAAPAGPVTIAKATGTETVSFTKDIAPFMTNLCIGCHSGNNPRGGLNLSTFEGLMKGGKSGRVILPGDWEGSLLWKLVGKQDPIKMPPGQALITRTNHQNLETWLKEGAKFDGTDPKAGLRTLVPTAADTKAAELAKLTPEEWVTMRLERTHEQWKRANPKESASFLDSKQFYVYGNVGQDRLKEVSDAAEEFAKSLQTTFSPKGDLIWKGKLTVFVFKDRFGFEEFIRVIEQAEPPRETTGISRMSPTYEDAYICLEDVGDASTEDSPGMMINLKEHLTGALLKQSASPLPDWLVRGTGLALAAASDKKNPYFDKMPARAMESLTGLSSPNDLFANGTFSSADVGPVGFTLVEFMIASGGVPNFGRFVGQLQNGTDLAGALQSVYRTNMTTLGSSYASSLSAVKKKR